MNKDEYKTLIAKVSDGTASDAELNLYNRYYHSYQQNETDWDTPGMGEKTEVKKKLDNLVYSHLQNNKALTKTTKLWPRYLGVAAAVAAIAFGIWFFSIPRHPELVSGPPLANDIAPGHNGATLTFANGKVVDLSDQKSGVIIGDDLRYNDNTLVIRSNPLSSRANAKDLDPSKVGMTRKQWDDKGNGTITANTAKGQTYSIILQDGTKVWLNSDSKLEFFSNYKNKTQRIVKLTGEGYFEVAKDKRKPFIVESNGQQVEVLGTHFNISAYKGETIRTTLVEGSIAVTATTPLPKKSDTRAITYSGTVLEPNEESTLNQNNVLDVKRVDATDAILWKEGKFSFNSEEMQSVMSKVSRWYNVDVVYKDHVQQVKVNGSVSRFANVSTLLDMLQETGLVHFKIEGRTVIVSR